ncbi:bis(5'-nucleosyl)-tetraphosphatase (symmetrical) YqeK [Clostridium sp. KNHs214]|uniref:bis(5'-nucleosyl)-tetraphosphatase (symmetrical) YqeK n=1 Tax=Clostridium sp. KNHs214 TaxID=1540257 RepID=UPI00069116B9|nr:bis(5'-nucleosyl)-tetraphosphatase (symmetrical) YqeK [Clostridium sp. KNHs214]
MRDIFIDLFKELEFTGDLKKDTYNFLTKQNRFRIAEHSQRVAKMCKVLAKQYGANEEHVEIAGLLHDIGGVYPNDRRLFISKSLGVDILPEEEKVPLILHQKISKAMAKEIFNINSHEILSAIECHTTLKKEASKVDKILFIADKIEWDQDGIPPYIEEVENGLNKSLEMGVFAYLKYQWKNRHKLLVMHPWLEEAYKDLSKNVCIVRDK